MIDTINAFSSFSVDDLNKAKEFYSQTLGIEVESKDGMGLSLHLGKSTSAFLYAKKDHQPATFTVLNFEVDDIDAAVAALEKEGVTFEHYNNKDLPQDEKGILRGSRAGRGPDIAWFKDPAGNILSIKQVED
ncbi:MAG: VOC family protein [Balneolaceae bacterium]|nr:VOC family protein [Balneolaceae bacterium]